MHTSVHVKECMCVCLSVCLIVCLYVLFLYWGEYSNTAFSCFDDHDVILVQTLQPADASTS